jgi:hypothetical protein
MATAKLREFLKRMNDGEMFSARDVLRLSRRRKTVYAALWRLNKKGEIFRVAQGLYIKGGENAPKPTVTEIAHAKASAFFKTVAEISADFARRVGIEFKAKSRAIFATNGRSSIIRSCHGPIQFIGASLRKIALQDSLVGVQLRTVWHWGRHSDPAPVRIAAIRWSDANRQECDSRFELLPYWLADMLALPFENRSRTPVLLE